METLVIKGDMEKAAELLKNGALVAVPTETVYGLACSGLNKEAVERVYEVKGRPAVKPLSLMVHDKSAMELYCEDVPEAAYKLADIFWPGPLTIVMKAKDIVPEIVRAGGETVGLRCPDHPLTLKAIELSGLPLAAPSANPSGEPSPKTADKVLQYFDGSIEAVIDGGECGIGRESTLIDLSSSPYRILREAALSRDTIADALVSKLRIIGITGGSGCGKTTALKELKKRGALVIDCDELYHSMLSEGGEMLREISARFPGTVSENKLSRKTLGSIVFNDKKALMDLNAITHRHIKQRIKEILRDFAMSGGSTAAIDAIELIGSGLSELCAATVAVTADTKQRIERITARDNISREYAEARIKAQPENSYYKENCSYTLDNSGDMDSFIININNILKEILDNG